MFMHGEVCVFLLLMTTFGFCSLFSFPFETFVTFSLGLGVFGCQLFLFQNCSVCFFHFLTQMLQSPEV